MWWYGTALEGQESWVGEVQGYRRGIGEGERENGCLEMGPRGQVGGESGVEWR